MATYKLRIPVLRAVQYDGTNKQEVKDLVGDTSEGEAIMVGTGQYEPVEMPPPPAEGEPPPPPPPPAKEIMEELVVVEGDWVTRDIGNGKIETNPEGFPDEWEYQA